MTEVIPKLYVGDLRDARRFRRGLVVCVLNAWPWDEGQPRALWIPVVGVNDARIEGLPRNLDLVAEVVHHALKRGRRVLVHCREGRERSPLAVAWYLCRYRGCTLDSAYELLRKNRPEVANRSDWIPEGDRP